MLLFSSHRSYILFSLLLSVGYLTEQSTAYSSSSSYSSPRLQLPPTLNHDRLWRALALGDYDEFNELFKDAQIALPDADVSQNGLDLKIRNLVCSSISIGDMQTGFNQTSPQTLLYSLTINPFSFKCNADYTYQFTFLINGSGNLEARAEGNQASAGISFSSPTTFDQDPPSTVTLDSCTTRIDIVDLDFRGGVVARILDLAEELVDGVLENKVEKVVCEELTALEKTLSDFLQSINERIEPYLLPIPTALADPLNTEQNLLVPETVKLISFNKTWFMEGLEQIDSILGEFVEDPERGVTDLAINLMMRKDLLDETGALAFVVSELPDDIGFNPVLFKGHDILTESSIVLDAVKIFGLDSLKKVDPLNVVGNYTIQNEMTWDFLNVELDLTINMKASSKDNALLLPGSTPTQLTEKINVKLGLNNIDTNVSLLLALDEKKLGEIELGSILRSENLFGCFLSSLHNGTLAGLAVNVGSLDDPILDGFVSAGVDRFISKSIEAVVTMYEPTMMRALPYVFQEMVRSILQESAIDPMLEKDRAEQCPPVFWTSGAVDFRDLFYGPDKAKSMGGSGTSPYGDLANQGYQMAIDHITEIGLDGRPTVNDMVVRPYTESQSGIAGSLAYQAALFSFARDEILNDVFSQTIESFEVSLSDVRITNLDTFSVPLTLLSPTEKQTVLSNSLTIGNSTTEPLTIALRLLIALEGTPPFNMVNEIDLSASVDSLSINADIGAFMDAAMVSKLPLLRVLDVDCWAATMATDALKDTIQALSIELFETALSSLALDAKCVSCSSEGVGILPEIVQLIGATGATDTLKTRLPSLLTSVIDSEWLQTMLNQRILDSPKFCSFLPEYNENATRTGVSGLPILPAESLDTVLYSGFLAGWVGFLVLAEHQRLQVTEPSDPLSAQKSFKVEQGAELLNWSDLGNSTGLGAAADAAMDQLRAYISSSDDGGAPGINSILESFLDDPGSLSLGLDSASFRRDGLVFSMDSISFEGLDSFDYVDILNPIGEQTLQNTVRMKTLAVEINLNIGYENTMDPKQDIAIRVEFEDVSINAAIFAAFDVARLRKLPLSTVLKVDEILPCLLSAMFDFQIPQFVISVGSIASPEIRGLSGETSTSMRRFLNATMDRFGDELVEALPLLFEGVTKELVSAFVGTYSDNATCPDPLISSAKTALVDLRDLLLPKATSLEYGGIGTSPYGDAISVVWAFVKENILAIDPATGDSPVNKDIIGPFTERRSGDPGRYNFGDLFERGTRINTGGLDAQFNLGAYDAYVDNLDTVGAPLSLLDPIRGQAYQLNNTVSAGIGDPIRLGGRFVLEVIGADTAIKNDVEISMSLGKITVALRGLLKVLEHLFLGLPIEAIGNWRCWLAMLPAPTLDNRGIRIEGSEPSLSLLELGLSVAEFALNVTCIECSGPDMQKLIDRLSEPGAVNATTRVANDVLEYATRMLEGDYLQVALDRLVADSKRQCPSSPEYIVNAPPTEYEPFEAIVQESSATTFILAVAITMVSLAMFLSLILLAVRLVVRRRHRKWLSTLSREKILLLLTEQQKDDAHAAEINAGSRSLFESQGIPALVRYAMPLVILGNIAFFLSGHLSLGGSISIVLTLAGESYVADNFFDFSMAQSTLELWRAGGKGLAILLLIFSAVWPYSKQLLTLFLWFAPPKVVSVSKRESTFLWLDALAKWSILDIFVLVLTLAAFRVSVQSPGVGFLPSGFYSLDLLVVPKWGLYANMIAQLISQISSHFIIHYHRQVVSQTEVHRLFAQSTVQFEVDEDEGNGTMVDDGLVRSQQGSVKERLCDHAFSRPHRGESERLIPRPFVNTALVTTWVCLSSLIVSGCAIPSYSLDILGIVGILVESGQQFTEATTYYNVFDTMGLLFDQAAFTGKVGDYIGLGTLATLLLLTTLVVPLVQSLVLTYTWYFPISRLRRFRLMIAIETLAAWQYAEVYFFAVLVASWQLGSVSEYIINAYCGSLSGGFAQLVYYGVLKEEDAQCFKVNTSTEPGLFLLAAGSILLALMNTFVLKAVRQYDRDKNHSARRLDQGNDKTAMPGCFEDDEDPSQANTKIHPVPVLFTDTFRWLLRSESSTLPPTPRSNDEESSDVPDEERDQRWRIRKFG